MRALLEPTQCDSIVVQYRSTLLASEDVIGTGSATGNAHQIVYCIICVTIYRLSSIANQYSYS